MTPLPRILFVEHVVWHPGEEWDDAVASLAGRFARAHPLDAAAVADAGPLHAQLRVLRDWSREATVDLDRELGRWFDEHLSMHVRPAPATTRAVRALAAAAPLHAASALPPRAAESILRHAGCWRSIARLHPDVGDVDHLDLVLHETGAASVIAAPPTSVPADATVSSLH